MQTKFAMCADFTGARKHYSNKANRKVAKVAGIDVATPIGNSIVNFSVKIMQQMFAMCGDFTGTRKHYSNKANRKVAKVAGIDVATPIGKMILCCDDYC